MQADLTELNQWLSQFKNREETIAALVAWRENRSGGKLGMQSVVNALANRVKRRKSSFYAEAVRPWQFTSISVAGDPQLKLFPGPRDKAWSMALSFGHLATADVLPDLTNGSTVYYNPRGIISTRFVDLPGHPDVKFPEKWNLAGLTYQTEIQGHLFFTEK